MHRGIHKENDDWNQQNRNQQEKDHKTKLKILMAKLANSKKEKDAIQKENKALQQQVIFLQSNLRQMVPAFSNTSSHFPMINETIVRIAEFYKYDCLDKFFDLLCPELHMKGIVYFFNTSFNKTINATLEYLQPMKQSIKKTGSFNNIQGPIMSVIRKAFQNNYKQIIERCFNKQLINHIVHQIQKQLLLGDNSRQTNDEIFRFIKKLGELVFILNITDPPLKINTKQMGQIVNFSSLKHDPFDGFIKSKQKSIIILPQVVKQNGQSISKAMVLNIQYFN